MSTARAAVIFDLDGTLVDSEPNYYEAGRRVLAGYGVTDFTWEHHTRFIGIGTRETLERLSQEYGLDASIEDLVHRGAAGRQEPRLHPVSQEARNLEAVGITPPGGVRGGDSEGHA
ncbi:HAD family hydrolase [Streptomyces marianii]|uniref:HAD family hydrolase n=1 Tax=Streptomyces marianii TaxID=1817406 RepID=UPI003899E485